jgi:predicted N-acetyltransferase YhbS
MADLPLILKPLAATDLDAIERLNARTFGPGRFARSAYRLREGMPPDPTLSFAAWVGTLLVGANIMTPIRCGDAPALLLGPLTVDPPFRSGGVGEALVRRSLEAATQAGHSLVLLVGDLPYYARFGFATVPEGRLDFCGPVDPARLLYHELVEGAFAAATGTVRRAIPAA